VSLYTFFFYYDKKSLFYLLAISIVLQITENTTPMLIEDNAVTCIG